MKYCKDQSDLACSEDSSAVVLKSNLNSITVTIVCQFTDAAETS